VFLFIVTLFTSCSNVVLGTFAAADNGNDVIHCQLIRREALTAIIAGPAGQLLFPPPLFAERPGLLPLSSDLSFTDIYYEWFRHLFQPNFG
jgi:hypothetical protein